MAGGFQKIVLTVAIIVFILLLIFIGSVLYQNKYGSAFPPFVSNCPDYWLDMEKTVTNVNSDDSDNSKSNGLSVEVNAAEYNNELVEIFLKTGIVTQNQLEHARRVLSKLETPRSLTSLLKELNFITDDQNVIGSVRANLDLGSNELGVYATPTLTKMLSAVGDDNGASWINAFDDLQADNRCKVPVTQL